MTRIRSQEFSNEGWHYGMAYSFGKKDFRMRGGGGNRSRRVQNRLPNRGAHTVCETIGTHRARRRRRNRYPTAQSVQKLRQAEHCPGLLRKASVDPRTSAK